ncbi:MAG: glutamate racemase [Ignavibacteria bacterium]|jgi:glutamate racemase|nr:glutamate racemase [Ignavibacteria bacterium]
MMNKTAPIGVFDSGIGGLSVLKQLIRFLPYENYVYLGDTARVPYGNKSNTTVKQYATDCASFLLSKKVKLIVVACNTVSAVALQSVKDIAVDVPVIGMIEPAAAAALHSTNNGRIGVIGTRATIASNSYKNAIIGLAPDNAVQVYSQECPLFVPLVEEGMMQHPASHIIAEEYLSLLISQKVDTLVLGCTHYPLLSPLIRDIMPNTSQIDSGEHSAVAALRLLADNQSLADERKEFLLKHNIEFYVTDYPSHFHAMSQNFLGFEIDTPQLVELTNE